MGSMEDADAALAMALQQEEFAAGGASAARADDTRAMFNQLRDCMDKVVKNEDELLQALALSVLPLDQLRAEVHETIAFNASMGQPRPLEHEDLLTQKMMTWFKQKFFRWTDNPPCQACGSKETKGVGAQRPNAEEMRHDASRTEMYSCLHCTALTRFPRYNDPAKLLETRCGRCGEWANCFLLFLRAAGVTARYVLDVTDHVWCEYYSAKLARWVHLDPCEAAFDKPLLYETGWAKKLSYVFSISTSGFTDVTHRYSRKWPELLTRRKAMSEPELAAKLSQLNGQIRAGLPQEVLNQLAVRDLAEQLELLECSNGSTSSSSAEALPGRTTGSLQWRQERGETGQDPSEPAPPPGATLYVPAMDEALGPEFVAFGRLRGGACRAAGENQGEGAGMGFDGRLSSKWLDFGGGRPSGTSWLEYRLVGNQAPVVLAAYDVCSGNDCAERDPCSWVLEGLREEGGALSTPVPGTSTADADWTPLDERRDVRFDSRHELRTFELAPSAAFPCRAVRLRITATRDPGAACCVQLSCLNLYSAAAFPGSATAPQAAAALLALAAGSGADGPLRLGLVTLGRILSNVVENPAEGKYRRVRASKLPAVLLSSPAALSLLAAVGFRPLLVEVEVGGGKWEEAVFLVMAAGEEAMAAARQAAAALKEGTAAAPAQ